MKSLAFIVIALFTTASVANNAEMKTTLVQVINQLQAIKPLLVKAEREQDKNPRIKVHFTAWKDSNGQYHAGLSNDIHAIQTALIQIVNRQTVEPRTVKPLATDFTH